MTVICPITGNTCPYNQKLESGVCPREHECDVIRSEYSTMLMKPPSPLKKFIIPMAATLVIAIAVILYFIVFDGNLKFLKLNKSISEETSPTYTPPITESVNPTVEPTPVVTPVITQLPAVPITNDNPTSVVRINVMGLEYEVKPVSLDVNLKIEAFPDATVVSWYQGSSIPGNSGNSILFGFKYYSGVSGALYNLESISVGDRITFTLNNGSLLEMEIYDYNIYPRDELPDDVFELESNPIRTVLITQAGDIDSATRDYEDYLVLFLH